MGCVFTPLALSSQELTDWAMQALLPALRQSHVERVSAPLQTAEGTRSDIASIMATRHILRSGYLIMSKADCLANTHFYITLASKQGESDRFSPWNALLTPTALCCVVQS